MILSRFVALSVSLTQKVSPFQPGQKTWKTIAGSVAQRWVVHDGWIKASYRQFEQRKRRALSEGAQPHESQEEEGPSFVDEAPYGSKKPSRIFR